MSHDAPEDHLPLSDAAHIGICEDGRESTVAIEALCAQLGVDALIRLHGPDFGLLDPDRKALVHFNLEFTSNQVGKLYAVVPIVTPGRRRDDGSEILPVVDPHVARRGLCTEVIQHLLLHEVTAAQFAESLPSIRNAQELGAALLQRYGRMFPDHSAADLLARGCALTRLVFQD